MSTNNEKKHFLDWATGALLTLTLLCTAGAAHYTAKQWETAVDTEQRQIRAYVFLRGIRLDKRNEDVYDIIPEWENTGNSPTVNMVSRINRLMFVNQPLPSTFMYVDIPTKTVPITLGPRSISNVSFTKVHGYCLERFNNRDPFDRFLIWGYTEYNDVMTFDRHITRFCYSVDQVVFSSDRNSAKLSYSLCDEGNCSDRECPTPQRQAFAVKVPPTCGSERGHQAP
ncbi:hypothetical protein [Methylocystis sp. SB2]|uniref:hypothetical protein n=1 Tax=Methylocystis sp. (strain SB2) TaxID=743836 RepID=UPI0012EDA09E|nr:hypothetical protein [Methylocystis sp. SB2]ULO25124.1 hypothetical protein LNB28_06970 [Methylocystis sp. SB2]